MFGKDEGVFWFISFCFRDRNGKTNILGTVVCVSVEYQEKIYHVWKA